MKEFDFEELKKGIHYELIYPKSILATRKEAMEMLGLSTYFFNKLRKEINLDEFIALGYTFFYKRDLYDLMKERKIPVDCIKENEEINYDHLKDEVRIKLNYPENKLFTRKTGPVFLKMTKRTFDQLRRDKEFVDYDHLGVKFFNRKEIEIWKEKRRSHIIVDSKPEYYVKKSKK